MLRSSLDWFNYLVKFVWCNVKSGQFEIWFQDNLLCIVFGCDRCCLSKKKKCWSLWLWRILEIETSKTAIHVVPVENLLNYCKSKTGIEGFLHKTLPVRHWATLSHKIRMWCSTMSLFPGSLSRAHLNLRTSYFSVLFYRTPFTRRYWLVELGWAS